MKVRLWKLGDIEQGLYPRQAAFDKLADIINGWDGRSDLDVVWGPDIVVQQLDVDTGDVEIITPDGFTLQKEGPRIRILRTEEVTPTVVQGEPGYVKFEDKA